MKTAINTFNFHLGRLTPIFDPRTLQFGHYLKTGILPAAPQEVDWTDGVTSYGEMLNDKIGNCTFAGIGHQVQTWTRKATGTMVSIPDAAILAGYSAISGYDPKTGKNDNGCVELDVLKYWRTTGVGGHKIDCWCDIEPTNHQHVMQAIQLFGGVYIGVNLPKTAQQQIAAGKPWTYISKTGDGAPGSWGGHCITIPKASVPAGSLTAVTWGMLQNMSWSFWDAYVEEVHVPMSIDWFTKAGKSGSGFDWSALSADLKDVSDAPLPFLPGPGPVPTPPAGTFDITMKWRIDPVKKTATRIL